MVKTRYCRLQIEVRQTWLEPSEGSFLHPNDEFMSVKKHFVVSSVQYSMEKQQDKAVPPKTNILASIFNAES